MALTDIITAINKINKFSAGSNWSASHNDQPIGPVENVGLGSDGSFFDPKVWVRVRFKENGKEMVVRGEHDILRNHISLTYGPQGNGDGAAVSSSDEFVLSNRLVTTGWRIVLEYVFEINGQSYCYRFDGTAIDSGDILKGVII